MNGSRGLLPLAHRCAVGDLIVEITAARTEHGDYRGPHEGWAVIREELDELWDLVRAKQADRESMYREAIQVACTAIRFAAEVADRPGGWE